MLDIASVIPKTDELLRKVVEAIPMDELVALNSGYKRYGENRFKTFVEDEKARFVKALETILAHRSTGTVVDLGCFIPYLPVALSLLGFKVKIVDNYKMYSPGFYESIKNLAKQTGIEILDLDILRDDFNSLGKNDVVMFMAVAEHLNGSPRLLMEKMRKVLRPDGMLLFEVPNIAEFGRRIRFLFGRSPLAHYPDYFQSAYPFMGHNREMTMSEVNFLLENSHFKVNRLECYDYSAARPHGFIGWTMAILKKITPMKAKEEVIMALATPMA